MNYDVGDRVTVTTELRDIDGTLTAATVTLTVTAPDGTISFPAVVDNGGTGKYLALFTVDAAGRWLYKWTASGALVAVDGGHLTVIEAGLVASAAAYIGASATDPLLADLVHAAVTLVDEYLGIDGIEDCPRAVRDLAINQLASELFSRRNSPGGVLWGPGGDSVAPGGSARLSRDAMVSVIPLLRKYAELGIA